MERRRVRECSDSVRRWRPRRSWGRTSCRASILSSKVASMLHTMGCAEGTVLCSTVPPPSKRGPLASLTALGTRRGSKRTGRVAPWLTPSLPLLHQQPPCLCLLRTTLTQTTSSSAAALPLARAWPPLTARRTAATRKAAATAGKVGKVLVARGGVAARPWSWRTTTTRWLASPSRRSRSGSGCTRRAATQGRSQWPRRSSY